MLEVNIQRNAIAVQDAVEKLKAVAHYVMSKPDGKGAIREIVQLILQMQIRWGQLMERYYQ